MNCHEREALERQVESLRRDMHQLLLEHDLLQKANELFKNWASPRPATPEQPREDDSG